MEALNACVFQNLPSLNLHIVAKSLSDEIRAHMAACDSYIATPGQPYPKKAMTGLADLFNQFATRVVSTEAQHLLRVQRGREHGNVQRMITLSIHVQHSLSPLLAPLKDSGAPRMAAGL